MPLQFPQPCTVAACEADAVVNATAYEARRCVWDAYFCEQHGQEFFQFPPRGPRNKPSGTFLAGAVHFDFELIGCHRNADVHLVYLREVGGERSFILYAGVVEVYALVRSLHNIRVSRPLTHEAMATLLRALAGKLLHVLVYDLIQDGNETIYRAFLVIEQAERVITIDVRPSDAFNLAVLCDSPIFVSEEVLQKVERAQAV